MDPWNWFLAALAVGLGWHVSYTVHALVVDLGNYVAKHASVAYHRYMHKRMYRKMAKDGA